MTCDIDKTKVLQVISNLYIGGAETQLVSLAAHIDRQRFDMAVCCIGDGPLVEHLERIGIKVFVFNKKPGELGIRTALRMHKLFKAYQPDIVHCQVFAAGVRGHVAAKLSSVPVLIKSYHGLNTWKKGFNLQLDRYLSSSTDQYVLVSSARRTLLTSRERIPDYLATVIHNGVDQERFALNYNADERRKKKAALGLDPDKCCIGTVGSLKPVKNQTMLLEAARLVRNETPDVQFAVVGGGPLRDDLLQRSKDLKLDKDFHFLGIRRDIPEVLQAFDIFTMHSISEDLSMAILEAMSASLPVVATDVGGNRELVDDGQTGLIVASGDADAMAQCILSLTRDAPLRATMGSRAQEHVEQFFSAEANARKLEDLYNRCLKKKTVRRESFVSVQS